MGKGKAWTLATAAFVLGLLLGLWWAASRSVSVPPSLQADQAAIPLPSVTLGDIRFTVFRVGKLQTRDEQGNTRWLRSFEVVIENLKNPQASLDGLEIDDLQLFKDGARIAEPIRSKMNDKFTIPPGLPASVSENALVLSGYQAIVENGAPVPDAAGALNKPQSYLLKFVYGPSKIPVALDSLFFP